jgi:hypothetical protein
MIINWSNSHQHMMESYPCYVILLFFFITDYYISWPFRPLQRFRYQIRRVMTLTFTLFFVTFILERKSLNYKILSTNLLLIKYSTK